MVYQKSDCLIVVTKAVKAVGAKGTASNRSQNRNIWTQEVRTNGNGNDENKQSVSKIRQSRKLDVQGQCTDAYAAA